MLGYAFDLLFGTLVPSLYIGTRPSAFTITCYSLGSGPLYSIYLTKPISSSISLYSLSSLFSYIPYTYLVSALSSNFGGVSGTVAPLFPLSSPSGLPPLTSPSTPIPSFLVPSFVETRCVCWLVARRPSSLVAIAIRSSKSISSLVKIFIPLIGGNSFNSKDIIELLRVSEPPYIKGKSRFKGSTKAKIVLRK